VASTYHSKSKKELSATSPLSGPCGVLFHDLVVCGRGWVSSARSRHPCTTKCLSPSHESISLTLVDYDWLLDLIVPCPYDTSVQLASPCRQLPRCHIHAMRACMYVRFTCRWSLRFPIDLVCSPVVILHAHGANRVADRLVTPRHAPRLASAKPSPPQPLAKWTLSFKLRQAN
jgi:hypothetical protein